MHEAINYLEEVLKNAPNEIQSKEKITQALLQLAEIQGFEDSNNEYRETFLKVDEITRDALNASPQSFKVLQNRAQLFATWALCENHHLQNADAIARNKQAVEAYSQLLNVAPSNADAYRGKGNCLRRLALLSSTNQAARLAMLNEAMECF